MISTLLCDLGGVLLGADPGRAVHALARLSGRPQAELEAGILGALKADFDAGRLPVAAFLDAVRAACRAPLTDAQIREAWNAIVAEPLPFVPAAGRLAARHPTYLFSNTDPLHLAVARERLPALGRFRGLWPSYEAGCLKPDPEYYRRAFRRFALAPASCVLVDDRPENVEAIVALGASGIVHESAERTEAALREIGLS